jgi:hypothetical protein
MLKNEPGFTRGTINVRVWLQGDTVEYRPMQALLAGGLAVHHKLSDDYHGTDVHEMLSKWTVSHVLSGLRIHRRNALLSRTQALAICRRCLPLTDWLQDEVTVRTLNFNTDLMARVDIIVNQILEEVLA